MHDISTTEALKSAMDKRILNEFGSKILNEERLEAAADSRKSNRLAEYALMPFHCECDDQACTQMISMSTEEYERLHDKTKYFIVVPHHVRNDLEAVINTFSDYVQVAKYFPHDNGA